jgi:formylglycine-generating enzyme required for sulfatase activity
MRPRASGGFWLILLSSAVMSGPSGGETREAESGRITTLIGRLGDGKFARREAAGRELEALGEGALPALRAAAAAGRDPEVRLRARDLERAIMLGCRVSRSTGLEMALIDAGEFLMGAAETERGRAGETRHRVRITRPFLMGTYEVTQDEYRRVMEAEPSWFSGPGAGKDRVAGEDTRRFPVENVTWYDAVAFCNRLSELDGYRPYYEMAGVRREAGSIVGAGVAAAGGNGYRLPTEAEWEYACRAGTGTMFHFGGPGDGRKANFKGPSSTGYGSPAKETGLGRTARVGSYDPNPWGLFDMHGNAGEWCWDRYDKDYYAASPADDPGGPDAGVHRVLRGGSWLVTYTSCRSACRFWLTPDERKEYTGFRVARTP